MVEHTDNQKQRENAENKTAFYYIRYRQANECITDFSVRLLFRSRYSL